MWADYLKTWTLLLTLTFLILIFSFALANTAGLTIALMLMIILNLLAFFYSDKIILKIFKAKKLKYTDNSELHDIIKEISTRASVKTPIIYLIPSNSLNALATGWPNKPKLAVTQGLLSELEEIFVSYGLSRINDTPREFEYNKTFEGVRMFVDHARSKPFSTFYLLQERLENMDSPVTTLDTRLDNCELEMLKQYKSEPVMDSSKVSLLLFRKD